MSIFGEFLRRNTINSCPALPLIHSSQALLLKKFMGSGQIVPSRCDVFRKEASYFFVGRPSYKHQLTEKEIAYWQLPVCFIFDFSALSSISTIYPFDTGAHHKKRMPGFIQMIDKEEYEVTGGSESVARIIGAFFSSSLDYFMLRPKPIEVFGQEFSLNVFDEEIRALHMLASASNSEQLDDRRLCIEVQTEEAVPLIKNGLLAVVCPSIYLDNEDFLHHVEQVWEAEPISYSIFPLSYDHYVSAIYEKVLQFYKENNIL